MKKCFFLTLSLLFATLVNAQLSGTYTINSNSSQNPDYTSLSAAASALEAGVSGQVIFEIAPGTYEEYVTINEINGTSATNRVIFRGMGADNQQVVITSNAGYTDNSTIKINAADYVTFENMTVTTTSANKARLLVCDGQTDYNRFENMRFVGAVSNNNLDGDKNLVYYNDGEWVCHNNEFVGCHFENGYVALYYQGHNIYTLNDGVLVENCTFLNQSFKGVYISFTDNAIVRGNTVTNHTHDVLTNYHAMDLLRIRFNSIIENNVMNVTRNSNYATVFETRPAMGTADQPVIIRNNIINFVCNVNSSYCVDLDDSNSEYVYFVNNTVKCSGTGNCGSIFVEKNWQNLHIYNNLIVNECSGYVFRIGVAAENRFCDYNRVSFSGSYVGRLGSNDYATLSDWTAGTGYDAHSALCTPNFVGNNDLHITSADGLTVANPLSYVTTDIDEQNRSATTPCAGADELASGATTVGTASFDDVTLGSNGYWTGEEGDNEMFSGGWIFTNYYSQAYSFWGGFTASNHTDLTQTGMDAQYTAITAGGYDGSAQYGVAYTLGVQTDVYASDGQAHAVTGCYVTNNLWAYQSVVNGDASSTPFGGTSGNDPDWFKLTATGKNASGQTIGTLDFYLADYRFANNDEDYVVDTWEWFDLSPLGAVHTISFSLSSTKGNQYGMLTPAYFCIDDFNGEAPLPPTPPQDEPPYIVNPVEDIVFDDFPQSIQVNLDGVATDPDNDDDQIVYSIVSNSNQEQLSAEMSGKMLNLTRTSREEATADLVMRATSNGLYVDFNIHVIISAVPDGIEEDEDVTISVYPNPAHNFIHVETMCTSSLQRIDLYDITGRKVLSTTETEINVSELESGVYFIRINYVGRDTIHRVLIERLIIK